jgi:hypothetical protein
VEMATLEQLLRGTPARTFGPTWSTVTIAAPQPGLLRIISSRHPGKKIRWGGPGLSAAHAQSVTILVRVTE